MTSDPIRLARAYLGAVAEPPAPALAAFVAEHGPVEAAERVRADEQLPGAVRDEVVARREKVRAADLLAAAAAAGAQLLVPEDPEWPREAVGLLSGAREVGLPAMAEPLALWVRGAHRDLLSGDELVSVVGARAASGYGEHVAAEFAHGLGKAGYAVVSGAAYGIDGAAHRGALAAGATTCAFLACGLDIDYPAGHARLLEAIAGQGVVLSEYPPGTPPRKHRFLVRNRLIAAIGAATDVVEAGPRSGAANTANTADALGRPVMAVPGQITAKNSVGCHALVRSGKAVLVTSTEDVLEILRPLGSQPLNRVPAQVRPTDALHPHAKRIHDSLSAGPAATPDEIAADCGLPAGRVRALLRELESAGLAVRSASGWAAITEF